MPKESFEEITDNSLVISVIRGNLPMKQEKHG